MQYTICIADLLVRNKQKHNGEKYVQLITQIYADGYSLAART